MSLSTAQIQSRIENALASKLRARGQLNGLDAHQLDGIGKALKKVAKKATKVVKKVAPIAITAVGAYMGGVAGAAAAKKLSSALKKKKPAAGAEEQSYEVLQEAVHKGGLPPTPAPGTSPLDAAQQIAEALIAARAPTMAAEPAFQPVIREAVYAQAQDQELPEVTVQGKPGWLIPGLMLAGAGLIAFTARRR